MEPMRYHSVPVVLGGQIKKEFDFAQTKKNTGQISTVEPI
jgi:hypothetical protein